MKNRYHTRGFIGGGILVAPRDVNAGAREVFEGWRALQYQHALNTPANDNAGEANGSTQGEVEDQSTLTYPVEILRNHR